MKKLPSPDEIWAQLEARSKSTPTNYQPKTQSNMPIAHKIPPAEQIWAQLESPFSTPIDPRNPIQRSPIAPVEITQTFNQPSGYDVFSGGVNTGVDYATDPGTDINIPADYWEVEDAYNQAQGEGYIGNYENQGYGNSIVVKNKRTGEKIRLSHLQDINPELKPGSTFKGGLVARTGATGNVTGPHLDAEYYDAQGNLNDILKSPYGDIIPHR